MSEITAVQNVGKIVYKDRCIKYLWKISDYSLLPQEVDHYIESPSFLFLDATWYLRLYPNGRTGDESKGYIGLYIVKKHSTTRAHRIECTFGIIQKGGEYYLFSKDSWNFEGNGCFYGVQDLVLREHILKDKEEVLPQETLTVSCVLDGEETDEADISLLENFEQLSKDFKNLLNNEISDVVIRVSYGSPARSEEFRAHRMILKARAPKFVSMFKKDMKRGIINIKECDPNTFRNFLSFLYSGNVEELSEDKVIDLYLIAHTYEVNQLKAICLKFMMDNISVDIFFKVTEFALKHNEPALIYAAKSFFKEHGSNITSTIKWLSFKKEYPEEADKFITIHYNYVF